MSNTRSSKRDGSTEQVVADQSDLNSLVTLVKSLVEGQKDIKDSINKIQTDQTNLNVKFDQLENTIEDLRNEIQGKITNITSKVDNLETKVNEIDTRTQNIYTPARGCECKVVISNITQKDDENYQYLVDTVNQIQAVTETNCTIIDVKRCEYGSREPKLVILTLATEDERNELLKFSYKLRKNQQWKNVYINCDRSKQERRLEYNIRQIVKSAPSLEFKQGKIVCK
jgi:uncharacterized phage infection (PIP) family protein YhgE